MRRLWPRSLSYLLVTSTRKQWQSSLSSSCLLSRPLTSKNLEARRSPLFLALLLLKPIHPFHYLFPPTTGAVFPASLTTCPHACTPPSGGLVVGSGLPKRIPPPFLPPSSLPPSAPPSPGGLLECGGDNLRGQVQVLAQVLNTLVGQEPWEKGGGGKGTRSLMANHPGGAPNAVVHAPHSLFPYPHAAAHTPSSCLLPSPSSLLLSAAVPSIHQPAALPLHLPAALHSPVIVPPGVPLGDKLLALEGLHQLEHLQDIAHGAALMSRRSPHASHMENSAGGKMSVAHGD